MGISKTFKERDIREAQKSQPTKAIPPWKIKVLLMIVLHFSIANCQVISTCQIPLIPIAITPLAHFITFYVP